MNRHPVGHSLPRSTPRWLLRHPILLVDWLLVVNALSRWRRERGKAALFVVGGGLIAAALVALVVLDMFAAQVDLAMRTLLDYWVLTVIVLAVYAATSVRRRRQHSLIEHAQSWLSAAPIAQPSIRVTHAVRSLWPTLLQFLAVSALILLLDVREEGSSDVAIKLIRYVAGGLFGGALIGWLLDSATSERHVGSRYVPRVKPRTTLVPSGDGLAGWPIAQVRAWSRPENSRVVLVFALLAVQAGSSALGGLAVVAMWLLASYLGTLLLAVLHVAKAAATWLRSTPVSFGEFAWNIARRAMLHHVLGTALAAGLMLVLGSPALMAVQASALWLVMVSLVTGATIADSYRGRSPVVRIALSLAAFAALAAVWQLRAGAKT